MTNFANPGEPNEADYLLFLRQGVGIRAEDLPADSMWIPATFGMAVGTVTLALDLSTVTPIYSLAVYNFGADRLINFALDQPNRSFFTDLRNRLGITSFAAGLVSSSGDNAGSSQSLEVIEAAKRLTVTQLQMMKTPYGRNYIGFAQQYGPTVWGLT